MSDRKYSHIIFDAGGTLIGTNTDSHHWYEQFFVDIFAKHDCTVTPTRVRDTLKAAAATFPEPARCSSDAQTRRFWEHVYSSTFTQILCPGGLSRGEARNLAIEYIDKFETGQYVQTFPGAHEILSELQSSGYTIGILSNFASYLRRFLEKLQLTPFIDFIVISAEHACEKPNPEIFHKAMDHCNGACPEKILYIGDNLYEDYHPARAHGMHALLLDRHDKHAHDQNITRITHLSEVLNHI